MNVTCADFVESVLGAILLYFAWRHVQATKKERR